MGDVAKWVILGAAILTIIAMILGFPIMKHADVVVYAQGITTIVSLAGDAFIFARGLVNNLLSPWARTALSGLMSWLIGKWLFTYGLKVLVWAYHYIFK